MARRGEADGRHVLGRQQHDGRERKRWRRQRECAARRRRRQHHPYNRDARLGGRQGAQHLRSGERRSAPEEDFFVPSASR
eukprot:6179099-Pleurochrysis_carterae.AAC.3